MQMKPRTANPAQTTPISGVWKGSYNKIRVEPITGGGGSTSNHGDDGEDSAPSGILDRQYEVLEGENPKPHRYNRYSPAGLQGKESM